MSHEGAIAFIYVPLYLFGHGGGAALGGSGAIFVPGRTLVRRDARRLWIHI